MKRVRDLVACGVGLVFLSPLLILTAALVKLSSRGPILYKAERIGKNGVPFQLYKFRTMLEDPTNNGPRITVEGDPRVTKLGRWLRKSKIDELPQLVNVLKGEMSLVGPRPEDPKYLRYYNRDQQDVMHALPGITSPASLHFRHEEQLLKGQNWEEIYVREILPVKLEIELGYLKRCTFWTDLWILVRTVGSIFR